MRIYSSRRRPMGRSATGSFCRGSGVIFGACTPPGSHRPRIAAGCGRRLLVPVDAKVSWVCVRGRGDPTADVDGSRRAARVTPGFVGGVARGGWAALGQTGGMATPSDADPEATVRVPVRVKPGASTERVGGAYEGPSGLALIVAVTARAVDGRATEAALKAVARTLGVRRTAVRIRSGGRSRDKVIEVSVDGSEHSAEVTARWRKLVGR